MAFQFVDFQSKKYIPSYACSTVALCLTDAWSAQTVSGQAILIGEIQNTGRALGTRGRDQASPPWENPRGDALWQYTIKIDDTQISVDIVTGLPFVLDCADILDVSGDGCFWQKFIDYVAAL